MASSRTTRRLGTETDQQKGNACEFIRASATAWVDPIDDDDLADHLILWIEPDRHHHAVHLLLLGRGPPALRKDFAR